MLKFVGVVVVYTFAAIGLYHTLDKWNKTRQAAEAWEKTQAHSRQQSTETNQG